MTKFTSDEKLIAVKRYLDGNKSQIEISDSSGVDHSVLQTWLQNYRHHGEIAFQKSYHIICSLN